MISSETNPKINFLTFLNVDCFMLNFMFCHSEVLILGAIEEDGKVILFHPSQKVKNGLPIA